MILILTGDGDFSSDFVVQYLYFLKYPFVRINSWDLLEPGFNISITNEGTFIKIKNQDINLKEVGAVWHRKFGFFKKSWFYKSAERVVSKTNLDYLSKEYSSLLGSVIGVLKDKYWLTSPYSLNLNKVEVLIKAQQVGLEIPDTFIENERNSLIQKITKFPIITKSVKDAWHVNEDSVNGENIFTMYTSIVKESDIESLPTTFFPSLIQRSIEKNFEIRVFCLLDKLYSMAIFSQNDPQTEQDFRKYNIEKPNRFVPFILPNDIRLRILKLVRAFNLNCCSIDLIKGKDDKYYFLEINTTGQFGMVDFPCNYGLHSQVAKALIKLDKMNIQ